MWTGSALERPQEDAERHLVDHLLLVKRVLRHFAFKGTILYIGSQIRCEDTLDYLAQHIEMFSIAFTVECFSRREYLMRQDKATLSLDHIRRLLAYARNVGFETNFLYILGLDPLEVAAEEFANLASHIDYFPIAQIYQDYTSDHGRYTVPEANNIEYFLEARHMMEGIFEGTGLRPRVWENYRGLWYLAYAGHPLRCIRM